jgi:hypothetical protein
LLYRAENRLSIFTVAVVDWVLGSEFALLTIIGAIIIIVAFLLLTYASWKEIQEETLQQVPQDVD